jgi:hypothetical protein
LITVLIDEAVGEVIEDATKSIQARSENGMSKLNKEADFLEVGKSKLDAEQQVRMMTRTAELKKEREQECNGLVIHKATYFIEGVPQSIDVTIPLQFWVTQSRLSLPATPKSHLLGFYNLSSTSRPDLPERHSLWRLAVSVFKIPRKETPHGVQQPTPRLKIRYEYDGDMYEITIGDTDPLYLPSPNALQLGPSSRVQ